jgi:SAM-dependent methyltransferase
MPTSEEHYRNLLAAHYSWMFGVSFDEKVAEQRAVLEPLLEGRSRGLAVDLGCGPGFQSFALAQLGFEPVHSFDTSVELLAELEAHLRRHPEPAIHAHTADILNLAETIAPASAAVVICMGDTLTHLPSLEAVRDLFHEVASVVRPGGIFILTWRDLTAELFGTDRFFPVRSSADTIMTCFLEYISPTTVQLHDLVYTREPSSGFWTLEKSSYPKLRIGAAQVAGELAAAGFALDPIAAAGRFSLAVARKPGFAPDGQ